MIAAKTALVGFLLAACGASVGPAQPWQPAEAALPPLAAEAAPAPETSKAAADSAPTQLRVVTYNVDEEDPNMTPQKLADAILADPDLAAAELILVQEEESHPSEARSRSAVLADLLGMGYVYVPARTKTEGNHGLAIFSVYPIENVEKMDLPRVRGQPRIAVAADIVVGARTLHVIDIHLEPSLSSTERLRQLRPAVIDAPTATLLAGDFNMNWMQFLGTGVPVLTANPAADQSKPVDSYLGALGFTVVSAASGTTAHASGYEARLDGIYARGLDVRFGATARVGPSDHWPLWADVTLP